MSDPIVVIPARLASSRLPRKPLALIGGRPMILHVLDAALAAGLGPVAVACAETELADLVSAAGAMAVLTDPALPSGSDRVHAALAELDPGGDYDVVVNLQGDLPVIDPADVRAVLDPLEEGFDIGTLVAPLGVEAAGEASCAKAACAFAPGAGVARALYFSRNVVPWGPGPLWHHIGVYGWRRAALARFVGLPPSALEEREKLEQLRALEAGLTIGCAPIASAPMEVNTPEDLARVRARFG